MSEEVPSKKPTKKKQPASPSGPDLFEMLPDSVIQYVFLFVCSQGPKKKKRPKGGPPSSSAAVGSARKKITKKNHKVSVAALVKMRVVSKRFRNLLNCENMRPDLKHGANRTWELVARGKWPRIPAEIKTDRWDQMVRIRVRKIRESAKGVPGRLLFTIENCDLGVPLKQASEEGLVDGFEWDFECPYVSRLTRQRGRVSPKDEIGVREYCDVCSKNVYVVKNKQDLAEKVEQGCCVIVDFKDAIPKNAVRKAGARPERRKRGKVKKKPSAEQKARRIYSGYA